MSTVKYPRAPVERLPALFLTAERNLLQVDARNLYAPGRSRITSIPYSVLASPAEERVQS